jgi:pyruvate-ferredoxin/flavodoxin oxidoreductase
VINGNGAVAHVMKHVCGGVIGYPITPSTEIAENFEAARAEGQLNVWGKHPFFVETEGEHSAQGGALGAAMAGGNFISNASSSQGILYGLEEHYATVGKRIGGFVLQVAARVVTRSSLNVMAGHDDIYSLIPAGYTILFGSNQQEAADMAAISYRVSSLSLIPVASTMDGFATSHVMSEANLPEPELLKEYLGDPAGRIPCPSVAQEILFGAKGRVWQLQRFITRHATEFDDVSALNAYLEKTAAALEDDDTAAGIAATLPFVPVALQNQWRRQWKGAWKKGTRQLCPALVDPNNPGVSGPVQNQPDFQATAVDHRTHFAAAVPGIIKQAFTEYAALTGRDYAPVMGYDCEDADYIMVGLGSITEDVRAVLPVLRAAGLKVGVASVKVLTPFPEAELVQLVRNAKAITILERSDDTALTRALTQALLHARANADAKVRCETTPYPEIGELTTVPRLTTAIFGLGGHDVQPRHIVAAYKRMATGNPTPLIYLGSQFFVKNPTPALAALQDKLRAAYPETELMALETEPNPQVLPPEGMRIRFHSVGGYGTIATGKLLTDILAGALNLHSKSAPKYGSEKSGAATNYYVTLSPEPVLLTNAELEDVEIVVAPDHMVFAHTNPLKGLVTGGTLLMQSDKSPLDVWRSLPPAARKTIRERSIRFFVIDAFAVARNHAPRPELEARMMGIAFIGAIVANVDRISKGSSREQVAELVRHEIEKKFGRKGAAIVEGNMSVIKDGMAAQAINYDAPEFLAVDTEPQTAKLAVLSGLMTPELNAERGAGLFDPGYWDEIMARPFREGSIAEAPVMPGHGMFMPVGTGQAKDKGIFRRTIPAWNPDICTSCMECTMACPDDAIPNTVHETVDVLLLAINHSGITGEALTTLRQMAPVWADLTHQVFNANSKIRALPVAAAEAAKQLPENIEFTRHHDAIMTELTRLPVARTRAIFDSVEKSAPGTGALYSVVVDPWKCTGCLQCVAVCPPHALTAREQDDDTIPQLAMRFERLAELPNTPQRFTADAVKPNGDLKRVLLDHKNYYAMLGGHGACRGCGEVSATHLVSALTQAIGTTSQQTHLNELEKLIADLDNKLSELQAAAPTSVSLAEGGCDKPENTTAAAQNTSARIARIQGLIATLEQQLYLAESGPTGFGPATHVIANSTGCSSVYASTMPFSPFAVPWVNGLFQDAQPFAVGLYEGIASALNAEIKATRIARMELADNYQPAEAAALDTLSWHDFTNEERALLPTVFTISGDGAAYDIGFGAMSRVLASGTPIKAMVLDTGAYSNTGGQASTASFTGQDSDLSRFGRAHGGKRETRKELGLLASFHPHVYVAATAPSFHSHFLQAAAGLIGYQDGAGLFVVYTPCGTENGFAEDLSNARSKAAVRSRMWPLFVHDPRKGETLTERFSLDGNPDIDGLWTNRTLEYFDADGTIKTIKTPFTPAEFAYAEGRFAKQFKLLPADAAGVPICEYIELSDAARVGKVPYIYATDDSGKLIKARCSAAIVSLVEDRSHYWQLLQSLAGRHSAQLSASHAREVADLKAAYDDAVHAKDATIDQIAAALAEVATASKAPAGLLAGLGFGGGSPASTTLTSSGEATQPEVVTGEKPIWLDVADEPQCANCATCYQELPQLFEPITIMVNGQPKTVAHMKQAALTGLEITPELTARFKRVKDTCDSEIIK